jgi:hypothetical protein
MIVVEVDVDPFGMKGGAFEVPLIWREGIGKKGC